MRGDGGGGTAAITPQITPVVLLILVLLSVVVGVLGAYACAWARQLACAEPTRAGALCFARIGCLWGGWGVGIRLEQRFSQARYVCENKARGGVRTSGTHLWRAGGKPGV